MEFERNTLMLNFLLGGSRKQIVSIKYSKLDPNFWP
jgi:hypothetical protein